YEDGSDAYAPLSDFFDYDQPAQTAKYIQIEQLPATGNTPLLTFDSAATIENAIIHKETKRVRVKFWNGTTWIQSLRNVNVVAESIAPVIDRSTISFTADGCAKEFEDSERLQELIDSNVVAVSILNDADKAKDFSTLPSASDLTQDATYANGTISFTAGGWFYIRLDIIKDTDEYVFANPTDGEITRTATSYVIPVFISKGTFVVTTQYGETTWQYGETESKLPAVKGTLGGREYTLGGEEVPVRLAYFKVESGVVNWTGYEDLTYDSAAARTSYNDPADPSAYKKLEVGTYRVVAVTQETDAYNASKTRQSAATTIVVKPKELSDSDLSPSAITYDRTAHDVIDNTLLNSKLVYGDVATAVFKLVSGNANYTNVGNYTPKIGFNGDTPNYTWASGSSGTIKFNIVKRTFPNFTFTLNKTQLYYGETSVPGVGSANYETGRDVYYTVNPVGYYAASAFDTTTGKPTGSAMTGSVNTWAIGTYYA
ncbi:MAG: hypothetical protein K2L87_05140, partial [Clostridiales bacterium]|nr:hypothetical protein [Clostridiales bacterium]